MSASANSNMTASNMTASNMQLMMVHSNEQECAICYKPINKYLFQCSAPCNKVYHTTCMEQAMEQTEEAAYEMEKEAEHKCCYCRRSIDVVKYQLHNLLRELMGMRSRGNFDVIDALKHVQQQIKNRENGDPVNDDLEYAIYEVRDDTFIKKPKQSNRAEFTKRKVVSTPRIRVKQNIGGRRR